MKGTATGGLLYGAGKLVSKFSPYVTRSIGKVLNKLSSGAKNILSKVSGKADDILIAFNTTSRELFDAVASKANNVVNSIKNSAQKLVDIAANKFSQVVTRIDDKVDDLLNLAMSKADDQVNVLNKARYNIRKALGLEQEYVLAGVGRIDSPPEETSYFENMYSKMDGNSGGKVAIDPSSKLSGKEVDLKWLSDNYKAVEIEGTVKVNG